MPTFDSAQERYYPEQCDRNLLCTHENGDFRFPARVSIAVTHLLARANADHVDNFDSIVIGVDKRNGRPFISSTLDPITATELLNGVMREMIRSYLTGKNLNHLHDSDPDSSPRSAPK